jgi:hypothetical protein
MTILKTQLPQNILQDTLSDVYVNKQRIYHEIDYQVFPILFKR